MQNCNRYSQVCIQPNGNLLHLIEHYYSVKHNTNLKSMILLNILVQHIKLSFKSMDILQTKNEQEKQVENKTNSV